MKKLYLKILLFLSPFVLNAIIIFIVDPYNFFNISHFIPDQEKIKCFGRTMETTPRGNICWKVLEYERRPVNCVLIGDSRMVRVNNLIANEMLGEEVYNFSIPGGNFNTLSRLFWIAAKNKELKEVYLQFVFLNFNKNVTYDLMDFIDKFKSKPLRYLYDKNIIIDSWALLYYHFSKNQDFVDIEVKEENIDLWKRAEKLTDDRLAKYEFPPKYARELARISEYCKENNIKLYVILLPTHASFLEKVKEKGLMQDYQEFNNFVYTLGETINLDTFNSFNTNKNNFKDYYHYKVEMLDSVARMTWREVKHVREKSIPFQTD